MLPDSIILDATGLKVLVSIEWMLLQGNIVSISLILKPQLLFGGLGLFVSKDQQANNELLYCQR